MRGLRRIGPVVLALALAGCTGTTAGQGFHLGAGATPTTPPSTSAAPTTTATETTTTTAEPTSEPPPTTTSAPPPTTTSAPPPPTTSAPPSDPAGQLTDEQWVVESVTYEDGGIGLFSGTARIRNDADTTRSGLYTFTLFDDETIVATLLGASSEVAAGDTVTVSLIGGEAYVEGEYSVDFQADSF